MSLTLCSMQDAETHIVCTNSVAHLDEHKLLSDRQHAFTKNYSCETHLITVINDWAKLLDTGGLVGTFRFRRPLTLLLMNF